MTHADIVEKLFRSSLGRNVNLHEILAKGIVEYSGRITDVRKRWNCTCGKDSATCTASEHIVNVKTGWYRYIGKFREVDVVHTNFDTNSRKQSLQQRIEGLRKQWKDADSIRKTEIEKEGKLLKVQLELIERGEKSKHVHKVESGVKLTDVQEALL